MSSVFTLLSGEEPVLVSMPHSSSTIPAALSSRMHPYAQGCPDTDWLLAPLYAFTPAMGLTVLKPEYARYVIDLNRPQDDQNLYPGQDTTGLCPTTTFERRPIYLEGQEPSPDEIQERVETYWRPYHEALQREIERLHQRFERIVLFEAHSIASQVPRFFSGHLPDLNLGTVSGSSCDPELQTRLEALMQTSSYTWVSNGRFKGGQITRAYARPEAGIHTVQLELSQATYLDEETGAWMPGKVARIQPVLQHLLQTMLDWARS